MRTTRPALAAALFAAAALLAAAAIGPDASAQAPRPAPAAAQTDAAYEAARLAFEALPEAERKAIQEALVWTGDHNGVTTGGFGRRTFEAIVAYQKRGGLKPDGTLDAKARTALQSAAKKLKDDAKFAVLADARTGIAIGVPQAVLPKRDVNPNGGSRWQSPDGKITLDTRAFKDGETDLPALYERNLAIQSPGRQVAYKVLRPDFFVVSGETATGKFYTRYAASPGGVRGFSLGYDKAAAKTFDRTVIAIANSFTPFPEAASAAATGPAPPTRPANLEPPRPTGPIATGLSVGPRIVVTSATVEACAELRVAKGKVRLVKADKAAGLALLEVEAPRRATPPGVRTDALGADTGVVALFYAGTADLAVVPGETGSAATLVAPLQPGAAGGPVFDRAGRLAGLIGAMPEAPRRVAGIVPPARYGLVPAAELTKFLEGAGATLAAAPLGPDRTAGEIAAAAGAAVVAVECAR
jgi:peptidoglycan hydrolase-like protein with peptidoglycan-binding domain